MNLYSYNKYFYLTNTPLMFNELPLTRELASQACKMTVSALYNLRDVCFVSCLANRIGTFLELFVQNL